MIIITIIIIIIIGLITGELFIRPNNYNNKRKISRCLYCQMYNGMLTAHSLLQYSSKHTF